MAVRGNLSPADFECLKFLLTNIYERCGRKGGEGDTPELVKGRIRDRLEGG